MRTAKVDSLPSPCAGINIDRFNSYTCDGLSAIKAVSRASLHCVENYMFVIVASGNLFKVPNMIAQASGYLWGLSGN